MSKNSVQTFLKQNRGAVIAGNACALALGLVTAILGLLVGPSVLMLLDYQTFSSQSVSWDKFFGPKIAGLLSIWLPSLTVAQFFSQIPQTLLIIAALRFVFAATQWFIWERLGERLAKSLRNSLIENYLSLHPERLIADPSLDEHISANIGTDVRYVREFVIRFYGGLPREAAQMIFLFMSLLFLSPQLLALFTLGVAPVLIVVSRLGKSLRKRARKVLGEYGDFTDWLQQRLLGIETIKHYHTEALESEQMQIRNIELFQSLFRAERIKAATGPLIELVAFFSVAMVLGYSFYQLFHGNISSAVQLSFFSTLGLFANAGGKLGKYFNINRESGAALERIASVMEKFKAQNSKVSHEKNLPPSKNKFLVSCRNISYRYPRQNQDALSNFSFDFDAGKLYCLKGESGSGKSTLMRVILGVLKPQHGELVIANDQPRGYLPQQPIPIADSILMNIAYPKLSADVDRAIAALEKVQLWPTIKEYPQTINTAIGLAGQTLSGGQEQRIHLARLFYHQYKIILVDEGTSALDPQNEHIVYEGLRELARSGSMVLVIAHRPRALDFADVVIEMSSGRMVTNSSFF